MNKFNVSRVIEACNKGLKFIDEDRNKKIDKCIAPYLNYTKGWFKKRSYTRTRAEAISYIEDKLLAISAVREELIYSKRSYLSQEKVVKKILETAYALQDRGMTEISLTIDEFYIISEMYKDTK